MKPLKTIGLAVLVAVAGCYKTGMQESEAPETRLVPPAVVMAGGEYAFEGSMVKEITSDEDNEAAFAVIPDIHSNVDKARYFVERFAGQGIDGIISPGDIGESEYQIERVLRALAEPGLPVFIIPGNHERREDYERAVSEVSRDYPNIIDMARYRVFDGDDADFVSLPGYQVQRFVHENGYFASPEFVSETGRLREGLDDAVVLITHGAGYTGANPGPATAYELPDVGDRGTARMMAENDIPFAVCGHIHEAGGLAATFNGENVEQGEWAAQFTANFGTLKDYELIDERVIDGMAGILYIKGNQAKYEISIRE